MKPTLIFCGELCKKLFLENVLCFFVRRGSPLFEGAAQRNAAFRWAAQRRRRWTKEIHSKRSVVLKPSTPLPLPSLSYPMHKQTHGHLQSEQRSPRQPGVSFTHIKEPISYRSAEATLRSKPDESADIFIQLSLPFCCCCFFIIWLQLCQIPETAGADKVADRQELTLNKCSVMQKQMPAVFFSFCITSVI